MMLHSAQLTLRSAASQDHHRLVNLIHFETHVHRHLDWRAPLDWMGEEPFLIAEQNGRLMGALACPMDPPGIAWLRLFAAAGEVPYEQIWEALWPQAWEMLCAQSPDKLKVAALPLQKWFAAMLEASGFSHLNDVIFLSWQSGQPLEAPLHSDVHPRMMSEADIPMVAEVDAAAFGDIWCNTAPSLALALRQAAQATVIEDEQGIVAYQISTTSHMGGHLARLAVHPRAQGRQLGYAILVDLLQQFEHQGVRRGSVNTQSDNLVSLHLYQKAGFHLTGETYPVYQFMKD